MAKMHIPNIKVACSSLIILLLLNYTAGVHKLQTDKLKFKISGRNLIDQDGFSTTDGYVEVFYTNDGGKTVKRLGRTETIYDKRNPDWEKDFEFHFDRKLKQYLFFHVYDDDALKFDDTVGRVWVNVADFVDKNQVSFSNLDDGGYLLIKAADKDTTTLKKKKGQVYGMLPLPRGTPKSKKIRFKVSVRGISKNDNNHETIVASIAEGVNGKEKNLGKSTTITASFNPSWKQVFAVNWNKSKDQRLHFKVYDSNGGDSLKEKDKVGDVWIQINDYIARGEKFTALLPGKGSLTITKA